MYRIPRKGEPAGGSQPTGEDGRRSAIPLAPGDQEDAAPDLGAASQRDEARRFEEKGDPRAAARTDVSVAKPCGGSRERAQVAPLLGTRDELLARCRPCRRVDGPGRDRRPPARSDRRLGRVLDPGHVSPITGSCPRRSRKVEPPRLVDEAERPRGCHGVPSSPADHSWPHLPLPVAEHHGGAVYRHLPPRGGGGAGARATRAGGGGPKHVAQPSEPAPQQAAHTHSHGRTNTRARPVGLGCRRSGSGDGPNGREMRRSTQAPVLEHQPCTAYSPRGEKVLYCEQCGCSGELGAGWVTVVRADVDENQDTRWVVEYCPPCAAALFGYRPDVAKRYVCVWERNPTEAVESP